MGIAALLKEANVARRSLYEHFGGKDELLAEVLRGTAPKRDRARPGGLPRAMTDGV